MIDVSALDMQVDLIKEWIIRAGKAVMTFYIEESGVFIRDTAIEEVPKEKKGKHPTSTNRCFFALHEYMRFLDEEGLHREGAWDNLLSILNGVVEKYFNLMSTDSIAIRTSSTNKTNMFTDGLLLMSVSLLENIKEVVGISRNVSIPDIKEQARTFAINENIPDLKEWQGGKVHKDDDIHDFVTLYAVRGLDAFFGLNAPETRDLTLALRDRIKEYILRLLAFHYAGVSSKFDPAELAFGIVLLNRFPTPDTLQITQRAVQTIVNSQSDDGSWPTARLISSEGQGLLHVASFEVALTLTHLLHGRLYTNDFSTCEMLLPAFDRAFDLVRSHYNKVDDKKGWANDHNRRTGLRTDLLESWTTAIVLTFLIHYRDALLQLRQSMILQRYETRYPSSPPHFKHWPDMTSARRREEQPDLGHLDLISDPKDNCALTSAIKSKVAGPVGANWIQRPVTTSLILYGPPGTRKTSLAARLAESLKWPLLTLSPPSFLQRGGLENFEACAADIFGDLRRLRRVVVLFDECEDFFKARPKADSTHLESRTVGAFITAGMLPRLQALRDRNWIIFILATNSKLEDLDPAVIRRGRFDYAEEIGYPTLEAQLHYVRRKLRDSESRAIPNALVEYARNRGNDNDAHHVSFMDLDDIIIWYNGLERKPRKEKVIQFLKELMEQKGPPSLT